MRVPRTRPPRGTARVAAAVAVATAAALTACSTTVAGHGTLDAKADTRPDPTGATTPGRTSPAPSPHPTPTVPPVPTTPQTFGRVHFGLPQGWRAVRNGATMCVAPASDPAGACRLGILDVGAVNARGPDPKGQAGWWLGAGAPRCGNGRGSAVTASTLVSSSFVKLGNKTAAFGQWKVTCAVATEDFSPRVWWLPVSKVAFVEAATGSLVVDTRIDTLVTSTTIG